MENDEQLPFVAAVILTHSQCALLARCLDVVLAQFHPPGIALVRLGQRQYPRHGRAHAWTFSPMSVQG